MAHVFLSPLSWGLGHATRDIPIIRGLIDNGHEVTVAKSRGAYHLLKKECSNCEFIYRLNLSKDIKNAEEYTGFPQLPKTEENMKRLYNEVFAKHLD